MFGHSGFLASPYDVLVSVSEGPGVALERQWHLITLSCLQTADCQYELMFEDHFLPNRTDSAHTWQIADSLVPGPRQPP